MKPIKSVAEAKIIALLAAENSKHESLEEKSVEVEGGGKVGKNQDRRVKIHLDHPVKMK